MAAYSMALRECVLADSDAGLPTKQIVEKYGVSRTWVRSLKQRRRETGSSTARVPSGAPAQDRPRATGGVGQAMARRNVDRVHIFGHYGIGSHRAGRDHNPEALCGLTFGLARFWSNCVLCSHCQSLRRKVTRIQMKAGITK